MLTLGERGLDLQGGGGRGGLTASPHAFVDAGAVVVDYDIEIRQGHVGNVSFGWVNVDVREWKALFVRERHDAVEVGVAVFLSSFEIEQVDLNMVLGHRNVGI